MPIKQVVFDSYEVGSWVCARTGGTLDPNSVAIGLQRTDDMRLIAGVLFDQYNGRSICMHVAAEGAGWMTREYLRVCFDYPFNQAKVTKILGLVDSTNIQARRFDEHLGFQLEATLKDAGKFGDLLIYSMTRQQCRFLKEMG
jgi:RimJ/RimL family protein N-acetyltransferase